MSSPIQSQDRMDTPTTTPPAPASQEPTPVPDSHLNPAATTNENEPEEMEIDEDDSTMNLPISKIKRIFKMDPDFIGASQSAVFATGVATELFVQYFTEQATLLSKIDRRKKILYKDFSTAVSSQDTLMFLNDTIPKTVPYAHVAAVSAEAEAQAQQDYEEMEVEPQPAEPEPVPEKRDITSMLPTKATINNLVDM